MRTMPRIKRLIFLACLAIGVAAWLVSQPRQAFAQQTTGTALPATATQSGPMLTVRPGGEPQINVRAGPARSYDIVGSLVLGQWVPALGRTPGGDWIEIVLPTAPGGVAWVYAYLTDVNGELPIVIPPPTPTPLTTPTMDPTLAAQFVEVIPPTRLPTFTPPPPLVIPTFPPEMPMRGSGGTPIGLVIIILGAIGVLGTLLSFLRRK